MSTIEYEQLVLQAKSLDYSRRVSLIRAGEFMRTVLLIKGVKG